jgi:hypothetical protein
MKHNRKTLKRKSLLKKRKGGKTLRRKSIRMKGGRDFGVMKSLGFQPIFSSSSNSSVAGICNNYGCCSAKSVCDGDNNYGKAHFFSRINSSSDNVSNPFLTFQDKNFPKQSPDYFMKLLGTTEITYCRECLRVICDPKTIKGVVHVDDATGSNFV